MWWPFKRTKSQPLPVAVPRPRKAMKKVIVGFIIGGAISSIVGAKLMQRSEKEKLEEGDGEDDLDSKED